MPNSIEKQSLEELKQIQENLEEIKERTPTPSRAFMMGVFQGGGAVIGSIVMVLLLGYVLSIFGVLPGFDEIGNKIKDAMSEFRR